MTYDPVTMTVTIPAGVEDFTVTFPGIEDAIQEDDETFTINLDGTVATGTITNDDIVTVATITDASELEGTDLVHTVTMSGASDMDETYPFTLTDNTTDQATDYTFPPTFSNGVMDNGDGTITVPAGVTGFTVTTPTTDDLLDEDNEEYTISIGTETATGTIEDNDEVTVQDITDATSEEGDDLVFNVTMSGESAMDEEYPLDLTDITATLGTDYDGTPVFTNGVTYDPVSGNITVPAGVTAFDVTFPSTEDAIQEDDETFTLTIGTESATGTITNDDDVTVVSIGDVTAAEGDDLVFTVDMSGTSDMDQVYAFDITDITATQGDDYDGTPVFTNGVTYDPVTMTITIPAGVEDFTVTFPGIEDAIQEDDETFTINLDGTVATGTITNDDIVTVATITDASELEGTDLVHTVTMSGPSDSDEMYSFNVTDVTASSGFDYDGNPTFTNGVTFDQISGMITIPAGVSVFEVTFSGIDDLIDENDETYEVSIDGISATGTIIDNDEVTVQNITNAAEEEGLDLVHTVTMSGASATDEIYPFSIIDDTTEGAADYNFPPTFSGGVTYDPVTMTITVPAGIEIFTITTETIDDAISEGNEVYDITVGAEIATGTIIDNEGTVVIAVEDAISPEGMTLEHLVILSAASATDEMFIFSITDVTTDQATDYTFPPSFTDGVTYDPVTMMITVPAGVTSFTVITSTVDDSLDEENEIYDISVGGISATGTIFDNDEVTVATISDATEQEGDDLTFVVTMSGESAMDEMYPFDVTDISTTAGADYDGTPVFSNGVSFDQVSGTITIPAGVTDFEVTFLGIEDTEDEPTETFTVSIGGIDATGTILDDDVAIDSITDATENEGDDLTHLVTLSEASIEAQIFNFDVTDITATAGDDYNATPIFSNGVINNGDGTITIPSGITSFEVTFPGVEDAIEESDETYTISIGGVSATGTIVNDDDIVIADITDATELEGTDLVHTVVLSGEAAFAKEYPFSITDNTTDQAADYTFPPTFSDGVTYDEVTMTVTVPAGVTSFTVTTPTTDDLLDEEDERLHDLHRHADCHGYDHG